MDGAPVEGPAVVALDQAPRTRSGAGGPVVVDELDQGWQQRHVAVVVQLADGDPEPVGVTDEDHGVVIEAGQIVGHRWWTVEELRRTDETVYPQGLADILERFL